MTEARKITCPNPRKLYVKMVWFFHWYLWIDQFVWARAFCGLRICYCASVGCNGTPRKIHMREIETVQSSARACNCEKWRISWSEAVSLRQMGVSEAFSLCWRTMWMFDMARRTCFREEYYTGMRRFIEAGKIAGPDPRKLYIYIYTYIYIYKWDGFSLISRDACVRLGSGFLWA